MNYQKSCLYIFRLSYELTHRFSSQKLYINRATPSTPALSQLMNAAPFKLNALHLHPN